MLIASIIRNLHGIYTFSGIYVAFTHLPDVPTGAGRRSITPYNKNRAYERELCKEERRHKLLRTKRSHQTEGTDYRAM